MNPLQQLARALDWVIEAIFEEVTGSTVATKARLERERAQNDAAQMRKWAEGWDDDAVAEARTEREVMSETVTIDGKEWVVLERLASWKRIARIEIDGEDAGWMSTAQHTRRSDSDWLFHDRTWYSPEETAALREMLAPGAADGLTRP